MDHLNVVVVLFWHRFLKASAVDPHLFQSCSIMGGGTPFLRMLFSKCELGHKRDGVAATKQLHSKFLFTFAGFSIIVLFCIVVGIDSPLVTARYLTKVYLSITISTKLSHTTPHNTIQYHTIQYHAILVRGGDLAGISNGLRLDWVRASYMSALPACLHIKISHILQSEVVSPRGVRSPNWLSRKEVIWVMSEIKRLCSLITGDVYCLSITGLFEQKNSTGSISVKNED